MAEKPKNSRVYGPKMLSRNSNMGYYILRVYGSAPSGV